MQKGNNSYTIKLLFYITSIVTLLLAIYELINDLVFVSRDANNELNYAVVKISQLLRIFIEVFMTTFLVIKFTTKLNKVLAWKKHPWIRALVVFCVCLTIGAFVFSVIYFIWFSLFNQWLDFIHGWIYHLILGITITIVIAAIVEGLYLFENWKVSLTQLAKLEKESIVAQNEALSNQISPHFLFNSLNALKSLIDLSQKKAQQFVVEFTKIYRYVLDMTGKSTIALKKEIAFINSYMFLQKIRHEDQITLHLAIDASELNMDVVPFTLQLLVENAIKHNEISEENPLEIRIESTNEFLLVKNKIKPKANEVSSTRKGLNNLTKRYGLLTNKAPQFRVINNEYLAQIPLLKAEDDA